MSKDLIGTKHVQNTTPRTYLDLHGFQLRKGRFVDGSSDKLNGIRWEIRIINQDPDLVEALWEKILEILK